MHFLHILDQTSVACADVSNNMLLIFKKIKKLCSGLFALLDSCSDLSLNLLLFTLLDCSVKLHLAWINPVLLTDNFHPFSSVETSRLHTQMVFLLGLVKFFIHLGKLFPSVIGQSVYSKDMKHKLSSFNTF